MGGAQIQISQQAADTAMDQALSELLSKLESIEHQLRQPVPDKSALKSLSDSVFAEKWVPGVITAVLHAILKSVGL